MTRRHSLLTGLMLVGATSALSLPGLSDPPARTILPPTAAVPDKATTGRVATEFGRLPLSFERNEGQTNSKVRFLTHTADNTLFLTPSEAVFTMPMRPARQSSEKVSLGASRKARRAAEKIPGVALRMQMVGSDPKASALTQEPLAGRINYFIGKDPSKWHAGVPTFGRVGFHGVYKGVDLIYYGNQKHLEYDFVVAPHADPKQIKLQFAGAQGVRVNAAGDLLVRTRGRELKWQKPSVYQQDATGKHSVAAHFRLKTLPNGQAGVSFALGHYNTDRPLVIDPVLIYSTFLGGTVTKGNSDTATSIALDGNGNAYVTGGAYSVDFPITDNAPVPFNFSQAIAFVTKLSPAGRVLIFSTFLGGSTGEYGEGIAVDGSGSAYVTGQTSSADFPVTKGALQLLNNANTGETTFVTKLDSSGSLLLYSTYLGGNIQDDAFGIAVDANGIAYVTGNTRSFRFPVTRGAFQTRFISSQGRTAFVSAIDPTGAFLLYSTYLGGSQEDEATAIAVDSNGSAYVTGSTFSTDFPTTTGAFMETNPQSSVFTSSVFVTKLDQSGRSLNYSTFLGGTTGNGDIGQGIAVDSAGSAYVTGLASAFDFPVTPGAYQQTNNRSSSYSGFVTKVNPKGTALVYSTFLGGSKSTQNSVGDEANGIAIDGVGNAYITGQTTSTDYPTTVGSFQRTRSFYGSSAFVTKLNAAGTGLMYSSYLGGAGTFIDRAGEYARGIAVDAKGAAYVAGTTLSLDFPVTPGAFQRNNNAQIGGKNSFVTKLSAIPTYPDFDNDGNTDLLIQNSNTNVIASWFMKGSQYNGGAYFSLTPPSDYALVGTGDFLGNGATSLVLQSRTTNQIAFWYTSGGNLATISGGQFVNTTPPLGWKVVGVGDFNGDGKSDLVFQNQTTNQIAIWFMNGPLYAGGVLLPFAPPAGWNVVGTGDFNADGLADLVFQNQTTNQIDIWFMNGTTYVSGMILTTVPASGYKVVGVGDYNKDGTSDLLLQNQSSNKSVVWFLNNGAYAGGSALSLNPPPGWKIVGPR